jgi:(R,R)-butanediol dehydrogenase/meso-butanediol dehydrogenase/diacetyl reductase
VQSVRWHGNRDVRVEDVSLRLDLGPGMIEVAVSYCGICGSDVAEYAVGPYAIRPRPHALSGQAPPVTLGHEFAGRVVDVGPGVIDVKVGDRVAADACWRCGECEACMSGDYNRCLKGGSIGLCSDGAFAPRIRFPAYAAVPLPDAVSDREGALLEPLAVGLHALDRGHARAGEPVVILGFGAIGAATAVCARAVGLDPLVSEPNEGRRARAEAMGFSTFVPSGSARDDAREVRRLTGGGSRLVVDATGVSAVLENAIDMTRRGADIVILGVPKTPAQIDAGRLVLFERSLVGSLGYVNDLPRVASLIATGHLDPTPMITRTIELEETPSELERLASAPGDDIKVIVQVGGAG